MLDGLGSMTQVDGGLARNIATFEGDMPVGQRTGFHAHAGDEHHIVVAGRMRFTQGDSVVEAGPGDYVLLDGTLPHDAESVGDEPARIFLSTPASLVRNSPATTEPIARSTMAQTALRCRLRRLLCTLVTHEPRRGVAQR